MKLSEAFDMYINDYLYIQCRSRSSRQQYGYCKNKMIFSLGNIQIEDLELSHVRAWEDYLFESRSQNTVRNYIEELKQVLKYAKVRGVDCLDSSLVTVPKRIPKTATYVTPEEVQRMIDCTGSIRTKFMVSFLYASGVRVSEMISLNRDSICDRQFTVIGKGKKERLCFIDERTEKLMQNYLDTRSDNCNALFVSTLLKERITAGTAQLIIKNARKRAGIGKKVTPHTFRHGHATNLIKNGADIRYVAQDLGHSNISTTMVYTHLENPDLKEKYEKCHTI